MLLPEDAASPSAGCRKKYGMPQQEKVARTVAGKQAHDDTIDLAPQLRELMQRHKLTVSQLAERVGVSKSAMEKSLAGPGSPRASTIRAMAAEFNVRADWRLFGYANLLPVILPGSPYGSFQALLQEMKQPGPVSEAFEGAEWGAREWRNSVSSLAQDRSNELSADVLRRLDDEETMFRRGEMAIQSGPAVEIPLKGGSATAPAARSGQEGEDGEDRQALGQIETKVSGVGRSPHILGT